MALGNEGVGKGLGEVINIISNMILKLTSELCSAVNRK